MEVKDKYFIKYQTLDSREAYDFYRATRRRKPREIDQYMLFAKCVRGMMMTLSKMIEGSEGGVYIQGLGYFCCLKSREKQKRRGHKPTKSLLLKIKKIHMYTPYFVPDKELKGWTMSDTACTGLKKKVNTSGIEYKLHFDACITSRIAEDFSKKSFSMKKMGLQLNFKPNF